MASDAADSHRPIGSIRRKPKSVEGHVVAYSPVWGPVAVALGVFLTVAGVMHFVNPNFFDAIVPPWLWPSERFWTYASGVADLSPHPAYWCTSGHCGFGRRLSRQPLHGVGLARSKLRRTHGVVGPLAVSVRVHLVGLDGGKEPSGSFTEGITAAKERLSQ
jgi:hypothetical protein